MDDEEVTHYLTQRQFLGEIDDVRFYGSGGLDAALEPSELERIRSGGVPSSTFFFIRGDCNGDGSVIGSTTDAILFLAWNLQGGSAPPCLAACDVDGDGRASGSVTDAIYLLQFNFLGGPPPPSPHPTCGPATESDSELGCASPPACR